MTLRLTREEGEWLIDWIRFGRDFIAPELWVEGEERRKAKEARATANRMLRRIRGAMARKGGR